MPDLREYTERKKILEEYNSMTNSVLLGLIALIKKDQKELLGVKKIFKEILNKDNKVFGKPLYTFLSTGNAELMKVIRQQVLASVKSEYYPTNLPPSESNKRRPRR